MLLLPLLISSQIELSEEILPSAGDVHYFFIDNNPKINLGKQGRNQQWDFSSLRSGLIYQLQNLKPDPVLIFNPVDYDFFTQDGAILKMYKTLNGSLYEVGIQRPHPLNSDYIVFALYEKPLVVSYAPLQYRSEKTSRSLIYLNMPGNQIPKLIQKRLPVTADSIRLRIETVRDFRVDAEGSIALSYDRYDVLRQEVVSRINTQVEIYSAGKWSTINSSILDPAGELLGIRSEKEYVFYSDEEEKAIASIHVDENDDVLDAEILAPEDRSSFYEADVSRSLLILSPNPTYGDVKLEIMNLKSGEYDLEVFNVIGKKLWGEKIEITKKLNTFKYNFGFLGKGTYLWAITDNQGVRITTKRLVIVTP